MTRHLRRQRRKRSSGAGSTASLTPPPWRRTSKCRWQPSGAALSEARAIRCPGRTRSPGCTKTRRAWPISTSRSPCGSGTAARRTPLPGCPSRRVQDHAVGRRRATASRTASPRRSRGGSPADRGSAGPGRSTAHGAAVADHHAVPPGEPRRGVLRRVVGEEAPARVGRSVGRRSASRWGAGSASGGAVVELGAGDVDVGSPVVDAGPGLGSVVGPPPQAATSSSAGSHPRMARTYARASPRPGSVAPMTELHDLTALEQGARSGPVRCPPPSWWSTTRADRRVRPARRVRDGHRRAGPPRFARACPGDDGPLAGVPTAIKDLNATKGVRTSFGSAVFADFVPTSTTRSSAGSPPPGWSASARPARPSSDRPATPSPRAPRRP